MTDTSKASAPKRALGATLAGVLAVGMVPAVAFAEQAPEPEALDNGIESLATDTQNAQLGALVAPASTSYSALAKAPAITTVNLEGGGTATVSALASAPYSLTGVQLYWFEVSDAANGIDSGYVDQNGQPIYYARGEGYNSYNPSGSNPGTDYPNVPGTYAVVAASVNGSTSTVKDIDWNGTSGNSTWRPHSTDGVHGGIVLTVTPASFAGAYVCDELDATDTTFPFKGTPYTFASDLDIAIDGTDIPAAYYTATITGGNAFYAGQATYAGTYTVQVVGAPGSPYEGQETTLTFTISPVDLGGYNLALKPSTQSQAEANDTIGNLLVNGQPANSVAPFTGLTGYLQITPVAGNHPYPTNGVYYPTLAANTSGKSSTEATLLQNSFINIPANVTYPVVDDAAATTTFTYAYYGGDTVTFGSNTYGTPTVFNKDAGQVFDPRQVSATKQSGGITTRVPGDAIEYQVYAVTNDTSTYVGNTVPTTPGIYCVIVSVNPANLDVNYDYDGIGYLYIRVTNGAVSSATLTFTYNNAGTTTNIDQASHNTSGNAQPIGTYTGQPQVVNVQAKLTDSGTVLPVSAYTATITQVATGSGAAITPGKVVSEMVDAGVYQITVTSTDYTFTTSNTVYVEIGQVTLSQSDVRITGTVEGNLDGVSGNGSEVGWFYTGQTITPQLQWKNASGEWVALDPSQYELQLAYSETNKNVTLTPTNEADAIKEAGYYRVILNDATPAAPAADNFEAPTAPFYVADPAANPSGVYYVTDENVYADVPSDIWYAKPVFEASNLDYMSGYQGTKLFGPNDPLLRGQAAIILSRMAGAVNWLPEGFTGSSVSFPTKFTDVDPYAYYAKSILWADDLGIMSGNGPAYTTFSPNDAISREQFAAILFNYAKKTGNYTAPTSAQMATATAMPDWNAVSPWAREAVAWAVANKVMGNNGVINPLGIVSRAEAAAMCVNYQPGGVLPTPLVP